MKKNNPFILLLLLSCYSCTTEREVLKTDIKYDSTAINEVTFLKTVLSNERELNKKIITDLAATEIYFDTTYLPGDTVYQPAKISIDNTGRITAEGNLKKVLVTNNKYEQQISTLTKIVDSFKTGSKKSNVSASANIETIYKEKKRSGLPIWIFFLSAIIGIVMEYRFKILNNLLSILKIKL